MQKFHEACRDVCKRFVPKKKKRKNKKLIPRLKNTAENQEEWGKKAKYDKGPRKNKKG